MQLGFKATRTHEMIIMFTYLHYQVAAEWCSISSKTSLRLIKEWLDIPALHQSYGCPRRHTQDKFCPLSKINLREWRGNRRGRHVHTARRECWRRPSEVWTKVSSEQEVRLPFSDDSLTTDSSHRQPGIQMQLWNQVDRRVTWNKEASTHISTTLIAIQRTTKQRGKSQAIRLP